MNDNLQLYTALLILKENTSIFILSGFESLWLFLDQLSTYNFQPNFIFTEKTVGGDEDNICK